ncbi:MAG: HEAT repeat domain-containing protein [Deltaproteobacteria bacterium]|nr:HEAT repeat domain-containing protein [Deltaproteobacteria bacterium]MBW2114446.1 HEAT repeat domain-containing protein [Deltaproteobacteria bacterium]
MRKGEHAPYLHNLLKLSEILGIELTDARGDLLSFLDDPHPNVVCMAFYSLGRRGNMESAKKIMNRFETSDHWYEQWYAYKALRTLGWKQTKSK